MARTSAVAPATARLPFTETDIDPLEFAMHLAGPLENRRALVIARHGLEPLCALLRHGCPTATAVGLHAKPEAVAYDLVLAIPETGSIEALVGQLRRALTLNGRVVACISNEANATYLGRRLRLNGFSNLQMLRLRRAVLLCAGLRGQP